MYSVRNHKFNKDELILHPGEYYCSSEDLLMSTILGSCVSVVLFDPEKNQGGFNHFLLPRVKTRITEELLIKEKNARYGIHAMEVLINELLKMGSLKENLVAKVFGGASMFDQQSELGVGQINTEFAQTYLKNEGIRIIASDTGGSAGRKIFFFPNTGRILLKKIVSRREILDISKQDENLKKSIIEKQKEKKIVLF